MRLVQALKPALPLVLLAFQPTAVALSDPPSLTTVESPFAQFRHPTGNGYVVAVSGSGRKIRLTVERGFSEATYVTRGRVSRGTIRARFGHFGLISMRFKPTESIDRIRPPRGCKGTPEIQQRGVFVGTLRFRGEEGYVSVDWYRVKGYLSTRPHLRCPRGDLDRPLRSRELSGPEFISLTASTADKQVRFGASGLYDREGKSIPFSLSVLTREQHGSVRIIRYLLHFPEEGDVLAVADDGRSATLRPSKPFYGEGTYDGALPDAERWSGTLGVSLLGADVRLTGPRFHVRLEVPAPPR